MRYLSLFSGIESATVAWRDLGWKAVGFSEIDSYCCQHLAYHYPHVPNVGDAVRFEKALGIPISSLTRIAHSKNSRVSRSARAFLNTVASIKDNPPDVVVGGSPCQGFSVAGRRGSLGDPRGQLTLSYARIVDHLNPHFALWENVPGVLSMRDNAFGHLLAHLAGLEFPLSWRQGKKISWPEAGYVEGPSRRIAWRTLSSDCFGLAQKRRRVFLVACPKDGANPADVLFESGDGETIPSEAIKGCFSGFALSDQQQALVAGLTNRADPERINATLSPLSPVYRDLDEVTERSAVASQYLLSPKACSGIIRRAKKVQNSKIPRELRETLAFQSGMLNLRPLAKAVNLITHPRKPKESHHNEGELSHAKPIMGFSCKDYGADALTSVTPTLRAMTHNQSHANGGGQIAALFTRSKAFAQNSRQELRWENGNGAIVSGLSCGGGKPGQGYGALIEFSAPDAWARRLTPLEYERLQGFPDGYTQIPLNGKIIAQCPDGPRYKAIGNSKPVPVLRWIAQRILSEDQSMESSNVQKSHHLSNHTAAPERLSGAA